MRKTSVTLGLALAVIAAAPVAAQDAHIGFNGGLTVADISGEFISETDLSTGFTAGLFADFPLSDNIAIHPMVQYARKGAEFEALGEPVNVKLDYIEIPLLARVALPMGDEVRFSLYGGPAFGFEIGCEADRTGVDDPDCADAEEIELDETTSFDIGAMFGAGVKFDLSDAGSLWIDGLYNLGLSEINDTGDFEAKNRAFYVNMGVSFNLSN